MKKLGNWMRGLIGAFIQAAATSITTTIVAPESFNFGDQINNTLTIVVVSGVVGAALFLQKKPLPGIGV